MEAQCEPAQRLLEAEAKLSQLAALCDAAEDQAARIGSIVIGRPAAAYLTVAAVRSILHPASRTQDEAQPR